MDSFWASICEALVCVTPDLTDPSSHQESLQQAAVFLQAQLVALPAGLRFGMRAGVAMFRAYVWVTSLRPFARLALSKRVAIAQRCAAAPIAPARQMFRALRNLALLGYYDTARETTAAAHPRPQRTAPPTHVGVLVIGSGAGGAVTAMELASRGHDVLIVEEGESPGPESADPGSTECVASLYRQRGMTPILGRVPIAYVEGCCVGGSTELNSGFWHRPPAETLLRWRAQYELDGASPEELCPHWQWAERALDVRFHDGPLPLSSTLFARGAKAMDWSVAEVPRTAARAQMNHAPTRADAVSPGMSSSVIPMALDRGAKLMSGYRVEWLDMRGARATGAVLRRPGRDGGERIRVQADHVFVCAGATETPTLLRRSGVLRNIGDSLRIHPMLKVAARFRESMNADQDGMPVMQVKEFWPDIVLGGAFCSRSHLALILSNNWADTHERMRARDHIACYYVGVRGTGTGRVRPSRVERGRTQIHYELSQEDLWNLSRGLARLSSLLLQGGALEVLPAVCRVPPITSQVDAVRWLDDRLDAAACSLTTVHAFSSCPIGERRDRCAADSFGKVHGFENIYINDASMIPDSPGVNPQGTIMTLARRNVQHFCDRHRA